MANRRKKSRRTPQKPVALPTETERVIRYWRASLIDGTRMEISGASIQQLGGDVSFAEILNGRVEASLYRDLCNKQQSFQRKTTRRPETRFENETQQQLEVLICPMRFGWAGDGDPRDLGFPRFFEPLWVQAGLTSQGELVPPRGHLPWVPRTLLEPISGEETFVIGDVDDLDAFTREYPGGEFSGWEDYWRWADAMFKAVCGSSIADFRVDDYTRRKQPALLVDTTSQGASKQALRLYDEILRGRRPPGLLGALTKLAQTTHRYTRPSVGQMRLGTLRHLGQFGFSFPLSTNQRRALHQALRLDNGKVLTITGPPGTGKTTMLQSIIASLWVQAAYQKSKAPPVIVACAGTNQAVTNVIRSFSKSETKPGPLAGRWLPDVSSYGCFCPSETRAKDPIAIPIERSNGEGLSAQMETWSYVTEASQHFTERVSQFAGTTLTLKKSVSFLHQELSSVIRSLGASVHAAASGGIIESLKRVIGLSQPVDVDAFRTVLEQLDIEQRHIAFQIATHYWEGRWLLAAQEAITEHERRESKEPFYRMRSDWQRRAMVTPGFVATFATMPRFFGYRDRERPQPVVDLLIVDEASQVLPEDGAAIFSLARRAVVVGDPEQLEPVRSVPEHVDIENAKTHRLLKRGNDEEVDALQKKGLLSSHGSVMLLAQSACEIVDDNTIGVFLNEHRRSVPGVVAFCNELAYRGRLKPMRPAESNPILPPLGYAHIPGECQFNGPSRVNVDEATSITAWLEQNRAKIEAMPTSEGRRLDQLVAVITPFAAQKRELLSQLSDKYPRMTIGTVHSLQGAECPIVIFSPVYDQHGTNGRLFFDRGNHMLNVAVSRAQDSFLVFGDMGVFNPDPDVNTPSGKLARFLFAVPDNELTDVPLPQRKEFEQEDICQLTTLAQHRQLLRDAFAMAESSVLIASPTISAHPIVTDEIPAQIADARGRGVDVVVYVDSYLNLDRDSEQMRPASAEGCQLIREAGAQLKVVPGFHNKTLAIDDSIIVEGSFNWFSAVRDRRSKHQKQENSFMYSGPKAKKLIQQTRELLNYLEGSAS